MCLSQAQGGGQGREGTGLEILQVRVGRSEDLVFSFEWQEAGEGLEQRRELIPVFTGSLWLHMGNRRVWGGCCSEG